MKFYLPFGAIGGLFFSIMMPYMPPPGWTILIIFCYALGGVAFFNWYMSRKDKNCWFFLYLFGTVGFFDFNSNRHGSES